MGFFDANGFLEPLSKILIFHGLCSERSFSTFFRNHDIYVDNKLVTEKKLLIDRETATIRIENKTFQNQNCLSTEKPFAAQESASAVAFQVSSSRETASLSKVDSKSKDCTVLSAQSHLYILMHKPLNCVCSRVSDKSKTVYEVLENALKANTEKIPQEKLATLSSLGRLDKDSTGLLLFSTNGSFNNYITSEKNKIPKTYYVKLKKAVTKREQKQYEEKLKRGIWLEAEKKAEKVFVENQKIQWESEDTCFFTIEQGIFHQVRRSFLSLGNEVIKLHRIKIGDLELPSKLKPGEVKILLKSELC